MISSKKFGQFNSMTSVTTNEKHENYDDRKTASEQKNNIMIILHQKNSTTEKVYRMRKESKLGWFGFRIYQIEQQHLTEM